MKDERTPGLWAKATAEMLALANKRPSNLANKLGLQPKTIFRWLSGERVPLYEEDVRAVNAAVAKFHGYPQTKDYLDGLAILEGLLTVDADDAERAVAAVVRILSELRDYFTVDVLDVADAIWRNGTGSRVLVALYTMRAKQIASRFMPVHRAIAIDELLAVLRKAGIDISALLRQDETTALRRSVDRFMALLGYRLASVGMEPSERAELLDLIENMAANVQLETIRIVKAEYSSRPDSDISKSPKRRQRKERKS